MRGNALLAALALIVGIASILASLNPAIVTIFKPNVHLPPQLLAAVALPAILYISTILKHSTNSICYSMYTSRVASSEQLIADLRALEYTLARFSEYGRAEVRYETGEYRLVISGRGVDENAAVVLVKPFETLLAEACSDVKFCAVYAPRGNLKILQNALRGICSGRRAVIVVFRESSTALATALSQLCNAETLDLSGYILVRDKIAKLRREVEGLDGTSCLLLVEPPIEVNVLKRMCTEIKTNCILLYEDLKDLPAGVPYCKKATFKIPRLTINVTTWREVHGSRRSSAAERPAVGGASGPPRAQPSPRTGAG